VRGNLIGKGEIASFRPPGQRPYRPAARNDNFLNRDLSSNFMLTSFLHHCKLHSKMLAGIKKRNSGVLEIDDSASTTEVFYGKFGKGS
jgi:hypothetical protein